MKYFLRKSLWVTTLIVVVHIFGDKIYAQTLNDHVDINNVNEKQLEHLIKTKIDSVRISHNCKKLYNDSILYLASKYHSDYMNKAGYISHFQENQITKTPEDRVRYFGGNFVMTGENVLFTTLSVKTKPQYSAIKTETYEQVANAMMLSWVNSKGHFKNIINCDFQITGLSISFDKTKNRIYACQVFGTTYDQFKFVDSRSLFPYSCDTSQISRIGIELVEHEHIHEFGLSDKKIDSSQNLDISFLDSLYTSLKFDDGSIYLKIENPVFLQQFLNKKNDGLAIEFVSYRDYMCQNDDYYSKPARRNGRCMLNGKIQKPILRDQLIAGFKNKKNNKEVTFWSFITKSDSLKIADRFRKYKIYRFKSEYFEIKLANIPKSIGCFTEYNLVFIKDNQIVKVQEFMPRCNNVIDDQYKLEYIIQDSICDFVVKPELKQFSQQIVFSKNRSEIDVDFSQKLSTFFNQPDIIIDSIYIEAYSSIEGDSAKNITLNNLRAQSVLQILQQNQKEIIELRIRTETDWNHFRNEIKKLSTYKHLVDASNSEILKTLNPDDLDNLEPIFQEERRASIKVYFKTFPNINNYKAFISKEILNIKNELYSKNSTEKTKISSLKKLESLYCFTKKLMLQGLIDTNFFANFYIPKNAYLRTSLVEKYWVNDKVYPLPTNSQRQDTLKFVYYNSLENSKSLQINRIVAYFKEGNLENQKMIDLYFKEINKIKSTNPQDTVLLEYLEKIDFNLHLIQLKLYDKDPIKNSEAALTSLLKIQLHLETFGKFDIDNRVKIASTAEHFMLYEYSQALLEDYKHQPEVIVHYLKVNYHTYNNSKPDEYFDYLIETADILPDSVWCNLFFNNCNIPFQSFDNERLRDAFCQRCLETNNALQEKKMEIESR